MNKKNISIDLRMIEHSGIGTYIQSLIKPIIKDLEEINIFLLVHKNIDYSKYLDCATMKNVSYINISSPIYSLREQIEIPIKLPSNIDLYWSPHYNIPILYKYKILVTIHDIYHFVDLSFKRYFRRVYSKFMFNIIKYKSSKIITVSAFSKNELIDNFNFNKNSITTIYNGIGSDWSSTRDYKKNKKLLYVGNFKKHKNLDTLINAFIKMKYSTDYELILIGGNINSFNSLTLEKINNYNNIKCYGSLPSNKLITHYNSAYLSIFPSIYEGFGLPPLEALACKCPILISDIPAFKEIYKDIACYFDPYDESHLIKKIEFLLENNRVTDKQINKSVNFINKYSWETAVKQTVKLINRELSL